MTPRIDLLQGTLEYLILRTLAHQAPLHGFGILDWITGRTDGALEIEEGALYPALHRMETRGWLKAHWGVSPRGRRAKFYALTRAGVRQLERERTDWQRYVALVEQIEGGAG